MTTHRILLLLILGCVCLAKPGQAIAQSGSSYDRGQTTQPRIQLTQRITADDTKPKKPLPYAIEEMPDIQEEMEIIHRRSQLMVARAPIARLAIADPTIVDVVQYSPNEIGIIGMNFGTTTLTMWFDNSRDPLIYLVEVIPDPSFEDRLRNDFGKLEKQLRILFPNSKVFLIPLKQRLIVKGQARDAEEAARILQIVRSAYFTEFAAYGAFGGRGGYGGIGGFGNNGFNNGNNNDDDDDDDDDFIVNLLEVPGNHQIMIHVTVAELSRSQLRNLGVDINGLINNGRHFVSSSLGGAGGSLTGIFENGEANLFINWLAGNRTAKILASPTLTVLSGHTASFLSGGEFPVPTIVGVGGAQGTSTSFRGFGTSLLVRPEVIDKDFIKMDITPEYSQINNANGGGGGVPGQDSRRVTTTVKLREGQTIVLAGLFGMTMTTEVNRIPFLGELPVIGPALFNAKNADQGETELLITVTPELVHPMEPDEVPPYPGFHVTAPNDIELYCYAKTEGYPDQGVYQLNPYGWGPGYATEIGYRPFNPATYESPIPMGGVMSGYQGTSPGFGTMQQQPGAVFPGPPVAPQQGAQPFPVQQQPYPQQAPPPTGAIQPSADPNVGQPVQQTGAIQQIGYQQPVQRSAWSNWIPGGRNGNAGNPASRATNSTTPSLLNGTDSRLGIESQAVQQRRQQQQMQMRQQTQYRK